MKGRELELEIQNDRNNEWKQENMELENKEVWLASDEHGHTPRFHLSGHWWTRPLLGISKLKWWKKCSVKYA